MDGSPAVPYWPDFILAALVVVSADPPKKMSGGWFAPARGRSRWKAAECCTTPTRTRSCHLRVPAVTAPPPSEWPASAKASATRP